jgi:hypothetical protein
MQLADHQTLVAVVVAAPPADQAQQDTGLQAEVV